MIPPKCRLCSETHWSPVCPKFQKTKLSPKETLARAQALGDARRAEKAAAKPKKRKAKKGAKA